MMDNNLNTVEKWLNSLDLEKYHQSFLDNGYDDLEICKQLGDPDLDAIGVDSTGDRQKLLEAVKRLNEQGSNIEYHTLEEESECPLELPQSDENVAARSETPGPGPNTTRTETPQEQQGSEPVARFTKIQLNLLLKEKLLEDYIDLSNPPYTLQNLAPCWSSLTALAVKYSMELKTYIEDILDSLEDLRWWKITEDTASVYSPPSMTSSLLEAPGYHHGYHSPQEGPPPIPSVPPPDVSHLDPHGHLQSVQTRYSYEVTSPSGAAFHPGDGDGGKKKTSTLGRLFRNIGFRKSSRKHSYKKQQGELIAHEITMGDNDRIALMQMVKEGKITTETALQVVKKFEEEKKKEKHSQESIRSKKGHKSKSKKSAASPKPTKSPSMYSDEENDCDSCSNVLLCNPGSISSPGQWQSYQSRCCPHRWPLSQVADPQWSPDSTQALLYSPMRSRATHPPAINSPVMCTTPTHQKIYTPVIPHELKMASSSRAPYGAHGIGILRDRLNLMKTSSCVHKTQSKASLISSESDLSLECSSHLVNEAETPCIDESYFCAFNAAAPAGTDAQINNVVSNYAQSRYLMTGPGQFVHSPDCRVATQNQSTEVKGQPVGPGQAYTVTQIVAFGRASCNYTPSEEEKDFLHLKRGDYIQILESPSPIYKLGRVNNKIGYFHDSMVETIPDPAPVGYIPGGPTMGSLHHRKDRQMRGIVRRSQPKTVEDLLQRLGLEHLCSVFSMNGYDSLEIFAEIDHEDLNALGILDSESRTKLLTAAKLLMDYEDVTDRPPSRLNRSTNATPSSQTYQVPWTSYFPPKPSTGSRDSGCYDSSEYMTKETAEGYSSINVGNKDNHRAVSGYVGHRIMLSKNYCDKVYNGANAGNMQFDDSVQYRHISVKPEKIYSEEDREVRNLTGYQSDHSFQNGQSKLDESNAAEKRNMKLNIPVLTDWKYMMDNVTQTIQPYPLLSESYHNEPDGVQGIDDNTHEQLMGFVKLKSKPFIKKNSPNIEGKDAQVQVMFPLGVGFTPSPQPVDQTKPQPVASVPVSEQTGSQDGVSFYLPTEQTGSKIIVSDSQLPLQTASRLASSRKQPVKQTGSKVGSSGSHTLQQTGSQDQEPRMQLTLSGSNCLMLLKKSPADELSAAGQPETKSSTAKEDPNSDACIVYSEKIPATGEAEMGRNTPIHMGFKSIKRSLIPRVTSKLASESIDLAQEPYSTKSGAYGIPPLLVQRYAEELKQDLQRVSLVLDQVRAHKLATVNRPVILADKLTETSGEGSELKVSSIADFFTSIGLPMYTESCCIHGYATVESLANLSIKEIQSITGAERKHLKRIVHALEWVQNKLASQSRKIKTSPVKDKV